MVAADYARFYGVVSGLSTTTLTGNGWAVGVMCAPAAGALVAGGPMSSYTDRYVDVADVLGAAGERLTAQVPGAMTPDPHAPEAARRGPWPRSTTRCDRSCRSTTTGCWSTEVVAFVEGDREVVAGGPGVRALRAVRAGAAAAGAPPARADPEVADPAATAARGRRAAPRLAPAALGEVAAVLGYADQAHFTRDFARVTEMTPGQFAARYASGSERGGRAGDP